MVYDTNTSDAKSKNDYSNNMMSSDKTSMSIYNEKDIVSIEVKDIEGNYFNRSGL